MGYFRFDGGHLGLWHRTNLRVEPSTYIPNPKVLAEMVTEIWATSGLTAAILDLGIEPLYEFNLVPTFQI